MAFIRVLILMFEIAAPRSDGDILFRHQIANAIATETDDVREQDVLARLAWYEGSFARHVASCRTRGDHGASYGLFQIQPRSPEDKRDACGTLNAQVRVALRYMHRSFDVCSANRGAAKLNLYTSGRCDRGYEASKLRWGAP